MKTKFLVKIFACQLCPCPQTPASLHQERQETLFFKDELMVWIENGRKKTIN